MTFFELIILIVCVTVIVTIVTLILNRKPIPDISGDQDVILILKSGNKLKAIKAYRQLHGVGLKEAKTFIEKCELTFEKEEQHEHEYC